MSIKHPLRLYGEQGSPYTRKMLSLLRYRHIPYEFLQGGPGDAPIDLPKPKVDLLPTFYLSDEQGEIEAIIDSTPIIRRLEQAASLPRAAIPEDPALSFLVYLVEDYADEWLTKMMFHYRWSYSQDTLKAGALLPLQHSLALPANEQSRRQNEFRERQMSRLHVVGSNALTGRVIEESYRAFLEIMDAILRQRPFLFGKRPSAADFAIYGQLAQLTGFDPTPSKLALELAPSVCAWVHMMEDLSGLSVKSDGWITRKELTTGLRPLLTEIGHTYSPAMIANSKAVESEEHDFETHIDGTLWKQPTFVYQARCLEQLRKGYDNLSTKDRDWITSLFEGTGCQQMFSDA